MDIDPIRYYYDPIDRNAILVRPKKPFYDWLARDISKKIGNGHILAIDRSDKAIKLCILNSHTEIETGCKTTKISKMDRIQGDEISKQFESPFVN